MKPGWLREEFERAKKRMASVPGWARPQLIEKRPK